MKHNLNACVSGHIYIRSFKLWPGRIFFQLGSCIAPNCKVEQTLEKNESLRRSLQPVTRVQGQNMSEMRSSPFYKGIHATSEMEIGAFPLRDHIEMHIGSKMGMECYFVQV